LAKYRMRDDCTQSGGMSNVRLVRTCERGQKATAALLERGLSAV